MPPELRERFKTAAEKGLRYLEKLVENDKANDNVKIKAVEILMERAYGKTPSVAPEGEEVDDNPLRIEFKEDPELLDTEKQDNLEIGEGKSE